MSRLIIVGGRRPATVTYEGRDTTDTVSNGPVMAFSNVPFGTAGANRVVKIIVIWVGGGTGTTITEGAGTTIGGVQADVDHQNFSGDILGARYFVGIISAAVPTGTSGAVQITFAGNVSTTLEIHSYSCRNLLSATPIDTGATGNLPDSDLMNVENGGVVLYGVAARNAAEPYTLIGVTEDYDANWIPDARLAVGSQAISADNAGYEVSVDDTDSTGTGVGTMASYR